MVGRVGSDQLELTEAHRFPNTTVALPDGLHWNVLSLFSQTLAGLSKAAADGELSGIGIDAWGVDYGLLDGAHRLLGVPFHYRDQRTEGMVELAAGLVPPAEMYASTGIQTMPINTVFQLLAEADSPIAAAAQHIALIPDLIGLWLTGNFENEVTVASTTGLLDARTGQWAHDLIAKLKLPAAMLSGTPIEPGEPLGGTRDQHGQIAGTPVWTVASHDTASAFIAAPVTSPKSAILSSGTWSLLGLELESPVLTPEAAAVNLTNERGVDGTTRLLRNVMGLWLVQECRRHWEARGKSLDYAELERLATLHADDVALFDPDHPSLLHHGDMPSRIAALCRAGGQREPVEPGEFMRAVLVSLACKYNLVLARLRAVTGREVDAINVIGGGARNRSLCQLTADMTRLPVIAGPGEASAIGNILIQARAVGQVASLAEMRELVARSFPTTRYEPTPGPSAAATYERFLSVTGLTVSTYEPSLA
jgi:rhamnulokinase